MKCIFVLSLTSADKIAFCRWLNQEPIFRERKIYISLSSKRWKKSNFSTESFLLHWHNALVRTNHLPAVQRKIFCKVPKEKSSTWPGWWPMLFFPYLLSVYLKLWPMCIAILGTIAFSHVSIFVCFVHNRERTRTEYEGGLTCALALETWDFYPQPYRPN
jgi:hypothetical protein